MEEYKQDSSMHATVHYSSQPSVSISPYPTPLSPRRTDYAHGFPIPGESRIQVSKEKRGKNGWFLVGVLRSDRAPQILFNLIFYTCWGASKSHLTDAKFVILQYGSLTDSTVYVHAGR